MALTCWLLGIAPSEFFALPYVDRVFLLNALKATLQDDDRRVPGLF